MRASIGGGVIVSWTSAYGKPEPHCSGGFHEARHWADAVLLRNRDGPAFVHPGDDHDPDLHYRLSDFGVFSFLRLKCYKIFYLPKQKTSGIILALWFPKRDQVPVKEVRSWLNVQSVKRLLTSEIT